MGLVKYLAMAAAVESLCATLVPAQKATKTAISNRPTGIG